MPVLGPKDIGAELPKGTLLARVLSPMTGDVIEEIHTPYDRSLIIHVRSIAAPIVPGMYAYQAADMEDAEVITR
jgi:hypothetical protein